MFSIRVCDNRNSSEGEKNSKSECVSERRYWQYRGGDRTRARLLRHGERLGV